MIQNVTGCAGVEPIECTNPRKDKRKIRWNIIEKGDGTAEWIEEDFDHKPTIEEVKSTIIGWYNSQVDNKIVSGFKWNGMPIWLSTENQFNYTAAFDAAVMSNGQTLPVTFKFGTDEEPTYHTFATIEDLSDFYYKSMKHVQDTLSNGWEAKDKINFALYGDITERDND